MSSAPALELHGVTKRFGDIEVVKGVDLQVRRGEFLTLLGASGCGKTTILRMMAGFEAPASGRISIAGVDVTRLPAYRRRIGMVFQGLALFPHLSVGENVAFGLSVRGVSAPERRAKVAGALAMVGLAGYEGRSTSQISGGQRQRVALARSLVTDPEVLLLDEPLSALDLKLRRQMQEELKAIQNRTGATFVFVTHDQEEALSMSDRIAVMREGRIEQIDNAATLYLKPANAFVATTLGDANLIAGMREGGMLVLPQLNLRMPAPDSAPAGEWTMVVRPEKIVVLPPSPPRFTTRAVVEAANFAGATSTFQLRAGDVAVRARTPFDASRPVPRPGETVTIGWSPEDCTFVGRN